MSGERVAVSSAGMLSCMKQILAAKLGERQTPEDCTRQPHRMHGRNPTDCRGYERSGFGLAFVVQPIEQLAHDRSGTRPHENDQQDDEQVAQCRCSNIGWSASEREGRFRGSQPSRRLWRQAVEQHINRRRWHGWQED
eukprot:6827611-Prymnesium_polylepis.1